jgi:hypothetical protein
MQGASPPSLASAKSVPTKAMYTDARHKGIRGNCDIVLHRCAQPACLWTWCDVVSLSIPGRQSGITPWLRQDSVAPHRQLQPPTAHPAKASRIIAPLTAIAQPQYPVSCRGPP